MLCVTKFLGWTNRPAPYQYAVVTCEGDVGKIQTFQWMEDGSHDLDWSQEWEVECDACGYYYTARGDIVECPRCRTPEVTNVGKDLRELVH